MLFSTRVRACIGRAIWIGNAPPQFFRYSNEVYGEKALFDSAFAVDDEVYLFVNTKVR
jgi:hypothetical protein